MPQSGLVQQVGAPDGALVLVEWLVGLEFISVLRLCFPAAPTGGLWRSFGKLKTRNIPNHDEPKATFEDLLLSTILLKAETIALVRLVEELAKALGVERLEGTDIVTRFQVNKIEAIAEALERNRKTDPEVAKRLQEYLPSGDF